MNAPVLPESAPFTAEQRQWLNGYLAGMLNASLGATLAAAPSAGGAMTAAPAAPARPAARVVVLFGSQSGNAEGLAHTAADRLRAALRPDGSAAFAPEVMGLERYKDVAWTSESLVLLATSTWGDGDMPDNAVAFWEWLKGADAPKLPQLRFSVLGLGDRNYNRFCQAGRLLDARLAELGAARLAPFCECDTDYEARAGKWIEESLAAAQAAAGDEASAPAPIAPTAAVNGHPIAAPASATASAAVPPAARPAPSGASAAAAPSAYGRKNPFPAPLLENHPLNAKGSAKDTRHISLSLLGSGLEYRAGDALGVMPRNCYDLVDRIILALNCLGNEKVTLEDGRSLVLRGALLQTFDLRRAPAKLLENLRADTRNLSEKRRLADLLDGDGAKAKEYLDGKDVLDVLEDFPHTRLEAQRLVECLGRLAPRLYSISSSPRENSGEVHLTVGIVRYRANEGSGRVRRGVASTYLAERVPLGMPVQVFVQPTSHFHLPEEPGTPIIMVGPGTGIAPFRAFLQERRALGDPGRNWLFFGDQRRRFDFLYAEEFIAWQESGFLTRLDLAFSRDQEEKIYVQDRMLENSRELYAWLEDGARFYVCGDAKRMAKDVENALLQVIAREGGKSPDAAKAYLEDLKAKKRYLRDVY